MRVICISADGRRWWRSLVLRFPGYESGPVYGHWVGGGTYDPTEFSYLGSPVYRERERH